jgi:hypothetical protein
MNLSDELSGMGYVRRVAWPLQLCMLPATFPRHRLGGREYRFQVTIPANSVNPMPYLEQLLQGDRIFK